MFPEPQVDVDQVTPKDTGLSHFQAREERDRP